MSATKKLTIGLPTCYDYSGAMFTIMDIVLEYFDSGFDNIELLIVDNTPDEKYAQALKTQINHLKNVWGDQIKLSSFPEQRGPAESKNQVFENASGDWVLCVDSHVMFEKGVIAKLLEWIDNQYTPYSKNLFSGPMRRNTGGYSTNFEKRWRGQMWGVWETDHMILESSSPVQAWGQGCGCLLARKDSWLGFNKDFVGFGGEEGYIHEKYRKAGRNFFVIPWLKWWHRFGNPDTRHYNLTLYSKVRNFVIGHLELGIPIQNVYDHFVSLEIPEGQTLKEHLINEHSVDENSLKGLPIKALEGIHASKKMNVDDWFYLIEDPIKNTQPPVNHLADAYNASTQNPRNDIRSHMETIRRYAKSCNNALDISRRPVSALPMLMENVEVMSYQFDTRFSDWSQIANNITVYQSESFANIVERLKQDNTTKYDMAFIKFPHDPQNASEVLGLIASKTSKYIAIHDTRFEYREPIIDAMKDLVDSGLWYVHYHSNLDWGLTILSTEKPETEVIAWTPTEGPGTELKKILESYGLKASKNCGCNSMARQMNLLGPDGCLEPENLEKIVAFLKNNAKKWFNTEDATWWKKTTLGFKALHDMINPLKPYEGLVRLAVRNAKEKALE